MVMLSPAWSIAPKLPRSSFIALGPSTQTLLELHPLSPTTMAHSLPTLHKPGDTAQDTIFYTTQHNTTLLTSLWHKHMRNQKDSKHVDNHSSFFSQGHINLDFSQCMLQNHVKTT
jgi:hypothetical protein